MENKQLNSFIKAKTGNFVVPIKEACERDGEYTEAYPTGYSIFDDAMKVGDQVKGGVRDGDLVVITGLSGHGKSTYAQNLTVNFGKEAFFSLWFSYEVLMDNLYAKFKEMGVESDCLIYTPKKNVSGVTKWIKEKIEEAQDKYSVKMVFIDHLDFLSPSDVRSSDQQRIVLKNICKELKEIAIDSKVIIFLMAHVKKVQGREVEMQDLSESSGIYQLADFVFSVSRTFDIEVTKEKKVLYSQNKGVIKILKNRLTGEQPCMSFVLKNNIIEPELFN